jgi:hypothetical protein
MAQQLQVLADPTANATQGGVNLPAGASSLVRLAVGNVWVMYLTSTWSTFTSNSLSGHVPCGDVVIVVGTDITHAVQLGSNGSVETTW